MFALVCISTAHLGAAGLKRHCQPPPAPLPQHVGDPVAGQAQEPLEVHQAVGRVDASGVPVGHCSQIRAQQGGDLKRLVDE
jgi:hypothetical protein